ncbi:hypothetical protein AgCh_015521 [Apium graveolens]
MFICIKVVSVLAEEHSVKFLQCSGSEVGSSGPDGPEARCSGPEQYCERGFTKYSELISVLLIAEQNNELLMKNYQARPTGSTPFPEVNVVTSNEFGQNNHFGRGYGFGRGRARGRGFGRGRDLIEGSGRANIMLPNVSLSHYDPRTNQCELEVQKIIHLQEVANRLPDAFTNVKNVTKSHIPAVNVPCKIKLSEEDNKIMLANESKARHKRGRPIGSKDKTPRKQGNLIRKLEHQMTS